MKRIVLSENQLNIIKNEVLKEANRIRRVRSDEFNPKQKELDASVFAKIKDEDEEYNKTFGLTGDDRVNRLKQFETPIQSTQSKVNDLQSRLTQNIQQRFGGKYQSLEGVDIPDAAKKRLSKAGLELEIKGKTFGYGNTKLPPTTMIINLTSAFNCPAKHCPFRQGICYAGRDEKRYVNTELRNLRNEFTLEKLTVKEILQLLDIYIKNAPIRIKTIRLSESGDFKSQEVVDFCEKMARHMEAKYGIRTACYTHQPFDFTKCTSMIVNSSLPRNYIKGADRNYLVCSKEQFNKLPEGLHYDSKKDEMSFKCYCDCYKCNFCYNTKEENGEDPNIRTNVYVEKH